jgi:hypothetical protein
MKHKPWGRIFELMLSVLLVVLIIAIGGALVMIMNFELAH